MTNRHLFFGLTHPVSVLDSNPHLWRTAPPIGIVVRIEMMNHMVVSGVQPRLPQGLYAITTMRNQDSGELQVVSLPRSLIQHPRFSEWHWSDVFPFDTTPDAPDYMRLLTAPDHVTAAVLALSQLSDTLPVEVDDGWLC